jgi:DNA-binding protein Fis
MAEGENMEHSVTLKDKLEALIEEMHSAGVLYNDAARQFKKCFVMRVLAVHAGNQCKAAREMEMHRNTFSRARDVLGLVRVQTNHGPVFEDRICPQNRNPAVPDVRTAAERKQA